MHTVKQYNTKLARLRSTRKMTKTMKMVSANKLRKAQDAQRNVTQYMSRLDDVTARLAEHADPDSHPLLCPRSPAKNILMVVIASDRGLCGGFNNNLNKKVLEWISDARKLGNNVELSVYGRRALLFFKNRMKIREHSEDVTGRPRFADACRAGTGLQALFTGKHFDEIYLAYNTNPSVMSHYPAIERLLPLDPAAISRGGGKAADVSICEPERPELLGILLPQVVNLRVFAAFLSNAVGEHGARMTAMDNATRNADALIDDLTLLRNRARQSAITTQLIEIVAGAEALK